MKRRDDDLPDDERRRFVKGGLLAAATALGFLPACEGDAAPGGSDPAGSGGAAPAAGSAGAAGRTSAGSGAGSGGRASSAGAQAEIGAGSPAAIGGGNGGRSAAVASGGAGSPAGGAGAAGTANAGSAADGGKRVLPRGMLGKTGVSIPIVGLGTSRLGERNNSRPMGADWDSMLEIFAAAIDAGIEYVDTGAIYGRAEEALGMVLPTRRDKVFLATKLHTDTRAQAQMMFERSLERMKTDHVDCLHLHNTGDRNLDTALSKDGSWTYILEQKAAGRARFVGITGHNNPPNFVRMLGTGQVDMLMTVMNFVDHSTYGLSRQVREMAVEQNMGVMAMKVFGGTESPPGRGNGLGYAMDAVPHKSNMELAYNAEVFPDCMRFVKALPGVTGMVLGVNHLWEIERNIQWAIDTIPFSQTEFDAIVKMGEMVAPRWADRYG